MPNFGDNHDQHRPIWLGIGAFWAEVGRTWADFDQVRPSMAWARPNSPGVDQSWPEFEQPWPERPASVHIRSEIGQCWARFRPCLGRFGQHWVGIDQGWPGLHRFGPDFGRIRGVMVDTSRVQRLVKRAPCHDSSLDHPARPDLDPPCRVMWDFVGDVLGPSSGPAGQPQNESSQARCGSLVGWLRLGVSPSPAHPPSHPPPRLRAFSRCGLGGPPLVPNSLATPLITNGGSTLAPPALLRHAWHFGCAW